MRKKINNCEACTWPDFDITDYRPEQLCKKHVKEQEILIDRYEREDEWFAMKNYRRPEGV